MKNYRIYLIRHGLTEANEKGQYCGSGLDIPLSDAGHSGLAALIDSAVYPYVDEVHTSPLLRARETANILYPGYNIHVDEDLKEASFGPFEGRTLDELKLDPVYQKWVAPTSKFTPMGVEPSDEFFSRCVGGAAKIINEMMFSGVFSAAIVTHASVIGNILAGMCLPKRAPYDWPCEPGCGYLIETNTMLWSRGYVCEVTRELPLIEGEERFDDDSSHEELDY